MIRSLIFCFLLSYAIVSLNEQLIFMVWGINFEGGLEGGMPEFVASCILAPLWEELYYRYVPLEIAKSFKNPDLILPVVIGSSIFFGWEHGGAVNIFVQGVLGMFLCYMYLKHGYWGSVLLHVLWNFAIFIGL